MMPITLLFDDLRDEIPGYPVRFYNLEFAVGFLGKETS
jgi:hypothetical protein